MSDLAAGGAATHAWRPSEALVDAIIAVALAVLVVISVTAPEPIFTHAYRPPNGWTVLLGLAASLPLAARRRRPLTVSLTVTGAILLLTALRWAPGITPFCHMAALYAVAAWRERRAAAVGLGAAYASMVTLTVLGAPSFDHPLILVDVLAQTIAWGTGRVMRRRRQLTEVAQANAVAAERARAVTAERAVLAERLRIARELHDVVSHTLSVIAVQSGVARYQREGAADPVASALGVIERASRSALDDLRRMLGLLRARPDQDPDPALAALPAPAPAWVREWVVDLAIAVVLAVLGLVMVVFTYPAAAQQYTEPTWWSVLLLLAATLSLAVRRRWPVAVLVVTLATGVLTAIGGWDSDMPFLCSYVAVYSVTAWRSLPVALGAMVLHLAVEAAGAFVDTAHYDPSVDPTVAGVLIPFGLGLIVRRWRRQQDSAMRRTIEAERGTARAAEQAVIAERLRIAEEMHDVIAHTLSAISVQAGVARHGLAGPDNPAGPALAAIETASRSALTDLRRMLGALHAQRPGEPASLAPSPGLDEIRLLASAHRAACGPIELTVDPGVETAPESLRMTAYRLVQEALTNVRKHAAGSAAVVRIVLDGPDVVVQVDNEPPAGTPAPGTSSGFGLAGMRERVAMFGGTLDAGADDRGGFSVRAVLRAEGAPA
ncbi:histidine kinase [Nonomuraea sp. NPDC048892]|uniref:sensor histidine kinase n=1 Tax=Nonomuraea sp. NPDC048892 TaxID=3154624 RepID=UPI0033DCADB3